MDVRCVWKADIRDPVRWGRYLAVSVRGGGLMSLFSQEEQRLDAGLKS
jgi:hypothetical protein